MTSIYDKIIVRNSYFFLTEQIVLTIIFYRWIYVLLFLIIYNVIILQYTSDILCTFVIVQLK